MNAVITLKIHSRPLYLYKVLAALAKCRNINKYPLIISQDDVASPTIKHQNREAIEWSGIEGAVKEFYYIAHDQTAPLGCAGHTKFCLDQTFRVAEADFAFHLEDDTLPSQDLIEYWEQVGPILDSDFDKYFAACTFHRPCHRPRYEKFQDLMALNEEGYQNVELSKLSKYGPEYEEFIEGIGEDGNVLVAKKWFDASGGFAMCKKQWDRINEMGGMFGISYLSEKGRRFECRGQEWLKEIRRAENGGFAWPFNSYFAENKSTIYPWVSIVKNIGKSGTHVLDETLYNSIHRNNVWWGHFDLKTRGTIPYDVDNIIQDDSKYIEHGIQDD